MNTKERFTDYMFKNIPVSKQMAGFASSEYSGAVIQFLCLEIDKLHEEIAALKSENDRKG